MRCVRYPPPPHTHTHPTHTHLPVRHPRHNHPLHVSHHIGKALWLLGGGCGQQRAQVPGLQGAGAAGGRSASACVRGNEGWCCTCRGSAHTCARCAAMRYPHTGIQLGRDGWGGLSTSSHVMWIRFLRRRSSVACLDIGAHCAPAAQPLVVVSHPVHRLVTQLAELREGLGRVQGRSYPGGRSGCEHACCGIQRSMQHAAM
jgi:hypothetical protein